MEASSVLFLVLAFFALVIVMKSVVSVSQGMEYPIERFGKYTRTLKPGLSFLVPFIDKIGDKTDMRERVIDVPAQEVITKDNVMVTADAVVLDEVLSKRDAINGQLLTVIDSATDPWGTKVTRIEIKDLQPPHDITQSMNKQMKAEREKRAEILTAEGGKQSSILRAEGEKEAAIREAEGRRQAAFLDAEGREREAEAEAKATAMVSTAIAKGDVNAINYFVAQDYVKAFGELAKSPNQKTIIVPAELSGLAATVGGIGALLETGKKK